MTEQEMFIEALMSQFMEPEFQFPDIGRRVAELSIQNNDMTWRIWQAARATPADAVLKNPTNNHLFKRMADYFDIALGKDTVSEALDKVENHATPADQDALDARRYRWLQRQRSKVWYQVAQMRMNETGEFIDSAIAADAAKGN